MNRLFGETKPATNSLTEKYYGFENESLQASRLIEDLGQEHMSMKLSAGIDAKNHEARKASGVFNCENQGVVIHLSALRLQPHMRDPKQYHHATQPTKLGSIPEIWNTSAIKI